MEHYVYHNLSRVFLFLAYFVNHVLVNRQLCRPDSSSLYDHNSSPASCSRFHYPSRRFTARCYGGYATVCRLSVRLSVCLSDRL